MSMIREFQFLLDSVSNIVFLTGAGISTNSGLPDFRGDDGFWKTNKPIFFKDFVTSSSKRRDSWKRNLALHHKLSEIKPNDGHHFVKRVLDQKEGIVITQNIDALHEKSGMLKEKIIEIHGNATKANCIECGEIANIKLFHAAVENNEVFPSCLKCGGLVKVATISFGQSLNMKDFDKAKELVQNTELMIVLGSSLQVQPVASLINFLGASADLVIVNKDPTPFDTLASVVLHEDICNVVNQLQVS